MVDLNYEAWLAAMCVMIVYRCLNSAYGRHSVPLDQSEYTHSMMIYDPIPTIPVAVFPNPLCNFVLTCYNGLPFGCPFQKCILLYRCGRALSQWRN